jgi:hypothetical protein
VKNIKCFAAATAITTAGFAFAGLGVASVAGAQPGPFPEWCPGDSWDPGWGDNWDRNGCHDDGRYNDGRYNDGRYDDGRHDDGRHDDGRYDDGRHDDGRHDDGPFGR